MFVFEIFPVGGDQPFARINANSAPEAVQRYLDNFVCPFPIEARRIVQEAA